jgi:hypothetical protein
VTWWALPPYIGWCINLYEAPGKVKADLPNIKIKMKAEQEK